MYDLIFGYKTYHFFLTGVHQARKDWPMSLTYGNMDVDLHAWKEAR